MKLIFKNSFLKIKNSVGRFISLILIVLIGTAFFSGIAETSDDMLKTLDNYYDENNLMDYKIVSTYGLTNDDVEAIKELTEVKTLEAGYSFETVLDGYSVKVYSLLDNFNNVVLTGGRMPEGEGEILVSGGYKIGDTITFDSEYINASSFTVVGIIESPLYIYTNMGISSVGDGKLDLYMYIDKSNFDIDYYTEIYIEGVGTKETLSYDNEYDDALVSLTNALTELKPIRETARYEEIYKEGMEEIYDAYDELNTKKSEAEEEFASALKEINSAKAKLNSAKKEYEEGATALETAKQEAEEEFTSARESLENSLNELETNLSLYGVNLDSLDDTILELEENIDALNNKLSLLDPDSSEYEGLSATKITLEENLASLNLIKSSYDEIMDGFSNLEKEEETFQEEYESAQVKLESAKNEIDANSIKLNESIDEYNASYQEYLDEIEEAEEEITNAKNELDTLEKPKWYLLTREDLSGYTVFYESSIKIDAIASIFPIFFIVIALLMCMNTMSRMIDEERAEIGLFSSLGIDKKVVVLSYIVYALLAGSLGAVMGLIIGQMLVPRIIYNVYGSTFIVPVLNTYVNYPQSIIILIVVFITMIFVTIYAISKDFKIMPAELLRPEIKSGKKVFLEKVSFIWKRFSFTSKVTVRNLFRYKKRIFMMLIGISGCTALLLAGVGLKDSMADIKTKQFEKILHYDAVLLLNEEQESESEKIESVLASSEYELINVESFTFELENKTADVYAFAFSSGNIDNFISLYDLDGNEISLDSTGAVVTEKLARALDLEIGDTFTVRNTNNELYLLKVSNIAENYVNHYIYMESEYYTKIFGNTYNAYIVNSNYIEDMANDIIDSGYFTSIDYMDTNISVLTDLLSSMNNIVFLIIGFSAVLAVTVLYNLTSINISERIREIATLKVLGFHNKEVSSYVYRETLILSIIGILIGLVLGVFLTDFVLTTAEMDEIYFVTNISYKSFILVFMIMVLFTYIIKIISGFILNKINMIDSLKSVE